MDLDRFYKECRLCPRNCGVDRTSNRRGFCGEGSRLRVAYAGPHLGEEPPISGQRGSGTVFFTGCSLGCTYCQNYQISRQGLGNFTDTQDLFHRIASMILEHGVHNVNLVTPDHFFPHTFELVSLLREKGFRVPIVYNVSGYQSSEMVRMAQDYGDIYLPDFKYSDKRLSKALSGCEDYPEVALDAISQMVKQKGFLASDEGEPGIAKRGVLVRHLILPGKTKNTLDALTTLFLEFGPSLPLSLMSQFCPAKATRDHSLNRTITREEFDRAYEHVLELGFEHIYVQLPEEADLGAWEIDPFLPDFRLEDPFSHDRRVSRRGK